jgi:nucleoside-diphosphate-sugar epimerase
MVIEAAGSTSRLKHVDADEDDPRRRRPDITLANTELGWKPLVPLAEGLRLTIADAQRHRS